MKFSSVSLLAALSVAATQTWFAVAEESSAATSGGTCQSPPYISPKVLLHGKVHLEGELVGAAANEDLKMAMADVTACCSTTSASIADAIANSNFQLETIGQMPQMSTEQTMKVLEDAKTAWNGGMGTWPQMSLQQRVQAIQNFLKELALERETIVTTLMWEIGKNRNDAEAEFDRTVAFVEQVIQVIETDPEFGPASWQSIGSIRAFVRRAAIGIIICLGPMNYPLNETYATLIPALLMGNVAIMKIPTVGGLSHLLTMEAFAKALPPGTMNFVSGRGRDTMPPLMKTGDIDALAFIGGSNAADDLIRQHPHPHRLKVFLQLEAKNMGLFFPDLFEESKASELDSALDQAALGALSFNGQRCTALKIFFVPKAHGDTFAKALAKKVEGKNVGLPWQTFEDGSYSSITPLPGQKQIKRMKDLILDALSKGARIMNKDGGHVIGGPDSTLMVPAVLYPVTPDMNIYHEEQFGPIVPIATYDSLDTFMEYGQKGIYGQQVSLFLSNDETDAAVMALDKFSSIFGKININSQCGRSPDTLPFSGRRSSAMGVMSVRHALMEFSIPTVVSYKDSPVNAEIINEIQKTSNFLQSYS